MYLQLIYINKKKRQFSSNTHVSYLILKIEIFPLN
jgi:hypothetical protein